MKKKFSRKWKSSRQTRKKRKYFHNSPLHLKRKNLSAPLSKDLRKKYGKRNISLRKGDTVRIIKGDFKGKKAKVGEINVKMSRVILEGIQKTKKDGTKANVPFYAWNLQVTELNLDDKIRMKSLQRKAPEKKEEKAKEDKKSK